MAFIFAAVMLDRQLFLRYWIVKKEDLNTQKKLHNKTREKVTKINQTGINNKAHMSTP